MEQKDRRPADYESQGIRPVKRTYGGRKRRLPPVTQGAFIDLDNPKSTEIVETTQLQANTYRGLRRLHPYEEVTRRPEGSIDVKVAKKALRQQAAIVTNPDRRRSRRPK